MFVLFFIAATFSGARTSEVFQDTSTVCYAGVKVFNDPHFTAPTPSAQVYVISPTNGENMVFSVSVTDKNGYVCMPTPCEGERKIVAETKDERALAVPQHMQNIPHHFPYNVTENRDLIIVDISQILNSNETGPIFDNKQNCYNQRLQYFSFHFNGLLGKLSTNILARKYDFRTSWYPTFVKQACFIKVQIQANFTSIGIIGKSYNKKTGFWFGTFIAPIKGTIKDRHAACIEFRCPVYDSSNKEIPTALSAEILKVQGIGCTIMSVSDELKSSNTINATATSFSGTFYPRSSYGPKSGVYIDKKKNAVYGCYTGKNAFESDYKMNPDVGIAMKYKCN
ncbi:uncharacterized protein LOC130049248 [Ostrea edulis]|uniref:uncharacterized protein LOC130049248 n=1 Tax=Ostrea edulis TaxID=37623 RepID=UPI0024AF54FB|nr:uncharacterized protein LOC130049248 [Ostrea edulis]